MAENIDTREEDSEGNSAHGNTRLPFGLCKKYGIKLPSDATPRMAWEALKRELGLTPEQIYDALSSGRELPQKLPGQARDIMRLSNNEVDINEQPKAKSLEQYLGERGLSSPLNDYNLDKWRIPHAETLRQRNQRLKESELSNNEYHSKRQKAIEEYYAAIERGELREPSTIEKALVTARGHEDNAATHAARRLLYKRGIDWRTGNRL